ncbi:hypothetical protein pb186bvf_003151 [Paramecium bursaria]
MWRYQIETKIKYDIFYAQFEITTEEQSMNDCSKNLFSSSDNKAYYKIRNDQ